MVKCRKCNFDDSVDLSDLVQMRIYLRVVRNINGISRAAVSTCFNTVKLTYQIKRVKLRQ